jgi:hypothetical protein
LRSSPRRQEPRRLTVSIPEINALRPFFRSFQHVLGAKKRLSWRRQRARVGEAQESSSGPFGAVGCELTSVPEYDTKRYPGPARPSRATTLATVLGGVQSTTDRSIPVPAREENRDNSLGGTDDCRCHVVALGAGTQGRRRPRSSSRAVLLAVFTNAYRFYGFASALANFCRRRRPRRASPWIGVFEAKQGSRLEMLSTHSTIYYL